MGEADSFDRKTLADGSTTASADGDGTSRTAGPIVPWSVPADVKGESGGREQSTLSAPTFGEATRDPASPDAATLQVDPSTSAMPSTPRVDHVGTETERTLTVTPAGDPSADRILALSEGYASFAAPQATHPTIPGDEIMGVLGRGGMGVVSKARHARLNRAVSLEMILVGPHAGAVRFLAEGASTGDHASRPEDVQRPINYRMNLSCIKIQLLLLLTIPFWLRCPS